MRDLQHARLRELLDGLLRDLLHERLLGEHLHQGVRLGLHLDELHVLELLGDLRLLSQQLGDLLPDELLSDAERELLLREVLLQRLLAHALAALLLWTVRAVAPAAEHLALARRRHGGCVRHG
ncbi:hypothetical protein GCM10010166_04560 [Couchioplanes caeruleus subsp. azureus]|nr:hypothetical protein GCM10010166_04560 [Couchioplanes caeruleus subsp. azureus]